ncbi:MAG TPA: hypothetical protein VH142_27265 [Polyangiaceae bacterium]|nr:hypothetical protein [Polyangiaceae bacterium]
MKHASEQTPRWSALSMGSIFGAALLLGAACSSSSTNGAAADASTGASSNGSGGASSSGGATSTSGGTSSSGGATSSGGGTATGGATDAGGTTGGSGGASDVDASTGGGAGSGTPSDASTTDAAPDAQVTRVTVGAGGGGLPSADGELTVDIPAGALSSSVNVTIEPAIGVPAGHVGPAYEIGPTGTTFAHEVTLAFTYQASFGVLSNLRVATLSNGAWTAISTSSDATHVYGSTSHFSTYGLTVVSSGGGPSCTSNANCGQGMACTGGHCAVP